MATLAELTAIWAGCTDCELSQTRTTVVVGDGDPAADLMFVGEAPGLHEDQRGVPFVGQAGKLLDELLEMIGLTRGDCYIANVLKCRPPGNRDPQPAEIEACQGKLHAQIAAVQPRLICTLGNFATKLLSGREHGVTRVHARFWNGLTEPARSSATKLKTSKSETAISFTSSRGAEADGVIRYCAMGPERSPEPSRSKGCLATLMPAHIHWRVRTERSAV